MNKRKSKNPKKLKKSLKKTEIDNFFRKKRRQKKSLCLI